MKRMRSSFLTVILLTLAGCAGGLKTVKPGEIQGTAIRLPDGTTVMAETMRHEMDVRRGMMFRDSLPEGRGMLFVHGSPGMYAYWMYQVKIPLDIVWLDANRRIVEISANTPPCPFKSARECPNFGGAQTSLYVLELPAGAVQKHGLKTGDRLLF